MKESSVVISETLKSYFCMYFALLNLICPAYVQLAVNLINLYLSVVVELTPSQGLTQWTFIKS